MEQTRPNIILLVGEDTGRHHGCYGDADGRTPRIDGLAAEGVRYANAFSTAPVCAPSRCTMVTGKYAWTLGAHHMRSTLVEPPRLFTHELREAGYHVNWHTKTDFSFEPPDDFADERRDWLEDLRAGTLPDRPFFLYQNFTITHESSTWPDSEQEGRAVDRRRRLHELPPAHHHAPGSVQVPPYLPDTPEVRAAVARYHDALSLQDLEIGRVLDALAASPYAANTVVIYLSDHGRGLPREKRWCYDAGIHLPLIVRWPDGHEAGSANNRLVSWVDLAPTLLALAGAPIPADYQGQVAFGPAEEPPREVVFAGRDRMDEAFDHVRVARDRRYHYIRNGFSELPYAQRNAYQERSEAMQALRRAAIAGDLPAAAEGWMAPAKPVEELYDSEADPHMLQNLADDPAHAEALHRLRRALDAELERFGDLGRLPERELIRRGVVVDRLEEYAARIASLPPELDGGLPLTVLEMPRR